MENRYSKGQIYKVCDKAYTKCYIGSTTVSLSRRMVQHRSDYKRYKEGQNQSYLTVYNLFDEFGVENCKIEWIEDYPCTSKKELEAREGHHQQENDCINKVVAGRTKQEWREVNRELLLTKQKEYRESHKEEIAKCKKDWSERNKDRLQEKAKEYYIENKAHINDYKKEWYEKNKQKMLEKRKEHYEFNKEHLNKKKQEYYKANKEKVLKQMKEYRELNRDNINQKEREYRQRNKERLNEEIRKKSEA